MITVHPWVAPFAALLAPHCAGVADTQSSASALRAIASCLPPQLHNVVVSGLGIDAHFSADTQHLAVSAPRVADDNLPSIVSIEPFFLVAGEPAELLVTVTAATAGEVLAVGLDGEVFGAVPCAQPPRGCAMWPPPAAGAVIVHLVGPAPDSGGSGPREDASPRVVETRWVPVVPLVVGNELWGLLTSGVRS